MNYLAHVFLAQNTPDSRLGNLMGDFVKGNLERYRDCYPTGILQGLRTHRLVDEFTDQHPLFRQSRDRVRHELGLYAGIAIDIFYDHFLSCHWSRFCARSRLDFITEIYILLESQCDHLPAKLQAIVPYIIQEDWLNRYQDLAGINYTFTRLHRRIKRENPLHQAPQILQQHYSELEADFLQFFPELWTYARSLDGRDRV